MGEEVHRITSVDATWRPGDVMLDASGNIWVRSDHPKWVWGYASGSTRSSWDGEVVVPSGSVVEDTSVRPLILLVRGGEPIGGRMVEENR